MSSDVVGPRYTVVVDSHYRAWLKEEGYGYIGRIDRSYFRVEPVNKGCDMTQQELQQAFAAARRGP